MHSRKTEQDRRVRSDRRLVYPEHRGCEANEAAEMDGSAFVTSSEASEVFEAVEASLDAIALPVGDDVVRDGDFAGTVRGDHGLGADLGDDGAQGIAVIGPVGKHGIARLPSITWTLKSLRLDGPRHLIRRWTWSISNAHGNFTGPI